MQKKELNIGTWDVQTMIELGELYLLVKELERSKMNITGLCEVRWSGLGLFTVDEHRIVYSGNEKRRLKSSSNCTGQKACWNSEKL